MTKVIPTRKQLTDQQLTAQDTVSITVVNEALSNTAWSSVDKSKLPDSCFLDPKGRRYPVREGAGALVDGRYTKCGNYNRSGLLAAWAAVQGARSGQEEHGRIRSKLMTLLKRFKLGPAAEGSKEMLNSLGMQIAQELYVDAAPSDSYSAKLDELREELKRLYPESSWINLEVGSPTYCIFSYSGKEGKNIPDAGHYIRRSYAMVDGKFVWGAESEVEAKVYFNEVSEESSDLRLRMLNACLS